MNFFLFLFDLFIYFNRLSFNHLLTDDDVDYEARVTDYSHFLTCLIILIFKRG